jgi:hypothetical protein
MSRSHPLQPLGLTHTNADYHTLTHREWTRSGLPLRLLASVTSAIAAAPHPTLGMRRAPGTGSQRRSDTLR